MKKLMILTGTLAALAVCADDVPEVSDITMTQGSGSRLVTITYTLDKAPAVVTLDIQTNAAGNVWASIGGENIQNVSGDVWKKVEAGDNHTITWRPDLSWPNHKINDGGVRAVVTAWSVDNPPDYMVVSLAANATTNSETYYPAVEFLPGGLLKNQNYRTSKIVMRKISAKGVTWAMGSAEGELQRDKSSETTHDVTLADNYYIAVFETTQAQWGYVQTANVTPSYYYVDRLMRPVEQVSYNEIRNSTNQTANTNYDYDYPNTPDPGSFLGLLREKTGLLFDLPSEAQWEFACRAGHGTGYWGDGSPIQKDSDAANLALLGRCRGTDGRMLDSTGKDYVAANNSYGVTNGTAIVGSYAPNSWGLYDMHGNVWEWCLDWYEADIGAHGGAVNVNSSTSAKTLSGASGATRVSRGGGWNSGFGDCRAARRTGRTPSKRYNDFGFRLALPASPAIK